MLRLFSIISLCVTLSMALAFTSIRQNNVIKCGAVQISLESKYLSGPFLSCCLVLALYIYRSLCAIPKNVFYCYVIANTTIMLSFSLVRFYAISFQNNTISFYLIFFSISMLTIITGIIRFFFNMGFQIDQNPHIVLTLLQRFGQQPSVHLFSNIGRKITGNTPISPGSSGFDRHFALGFGTFVAGSVAAGSGVYLCYEAYQSRMLNIRNLNISEINSDRQAVKDGFMSKENYNKKWDDFGRPIK